MQCQATASYRPAEEVALYYRLRYQVGLVIRDASRCAGLAHGMAHNQEKIDFHANRSVAAAG